MVSSWATAAGALLMRHIHRQRQSQLELLTCRSCCKQHIWDLSQPDSQSDASSLLRFSCVHQRMFLMGSFVQRRPGMEGIYMLYKGRMWMCRLLHSHNYQWAHTLQVLSWGLGILASLKPCRYGQRPGCSDSSCLQIRPDQSRPQLLKSKISSYVNLCRHSPAECRRHQHHPLRTPITPR